MPQQLNPALYLIPPIDPETGRFHREWQRFFNDINRRVAILEAKSATGITENIVLATTTTVTVVDGVVTDTV